MLRIIWPGSLVACPMVIFATILISFGLSLKYSFGSDDATVFTDSYPSLRDCVLSRQYKTSLLLTAVVSIPIIAEVVMDGFSFIAENLSERICWVTRLLLIISLVLPKLVVFVGNFPTNNSVQAHFCSAAFSHVVSRGCICIFLSQNQQMLGIGPITVSISIFYLIGNYVQLVNQHNDENSVTGAVTFFFAVAYAQFAFIFAKLLFKWITARRKLCAVDVCNIVYFVALLVISAGSFAVDQFYSNGCTPMSLSLQNYLIILFIFVMGVLPGQVARIKYKEALHKMEERDGFIRYISHEIRTPLNTVFLGMNYIKGELNGIAPLVSEYVNPIIETVNEVNDCCEVAVSILNDLLTFDKLEEGKMTLDLKDTDIERFVLETIKPFHIQAREKDIKVDVVIDNHASGWTQSSVLRIDQHKMSQVIRNLVSNAIKFTPVEGVIVVKASVVKVFVRSQSKTSLENISSATRMYSLAMMKSSLSLTQWKDPSKQRPAPPSRSRSRSNEQKSIIGAPSLPRGSVRGGILADYLRLEVQDNGAGISAENQKRLFGQYVQFNAGKLQQGNGSGLGLWISKGITELHGGCIGAASAGEGRGSTFFFELPLFPASPSHKPADYSPCRKESYTSGNVMRHPKVSGQKSNFSLSDLVSLDKKIRCRVGSSDHLFNEMVLSQNASLKGSRPHSSSTSYKGRGESEGLTNKMEFPGRRNSTGWMSLTAAFGRDSFRVGVLNSDIEDVDIEAGPTPSSGTRPCLKPREPPPETSGGTGPCLKYREPSAETQVETPNSAQIRVLVVDDSLPTRKLLCKILSSKGYLVNSAGDGMSCIDLVGSAGTCPGGRFVDKKAAFDVIIMDDNMPKMTGTKTSKILRENGYKGFICGVTGNTSPTDVNRFIENGASLVLPKPLDLILFEKEVKDFLRRKGNSSNNSLDRTV